MLDSAYLISVAWCTFFVGCTIPFKNFKDFFPRHEKKCNKFGLRFHDCLRKVGPESPPVVNHCSRSWVEPSVSTGQRASLIHLAFYQCLWLNHGEAVPGLQHGANGGSTNDTPGGKHFTANLSPTLFMASLRCQSPMLSIHICQRWGSFKRKLHSSLNEKNELYLFSVWYTL